MKLTAARLMELAASAMEAAKPRNSFGVNGMLRKLAQVQQLAADTGMGQVQVEMPEPPVPKKKPAKKASRKRRGGTKRSPVATEMFSSAAEPHE